MIRRFRLEAEGRLKEDVIEELTARSTQLISVLAKIGPSKQDRINWECTDDAVTGNEKDGYKGRMVLVYRNDT